MGRPNESARCCLDSRRRDLSESGRRGRPSLWNKLTRDQGLAFVGLSPGGRFDVNFGHTEDENDEDDFLDISFLGLDGQPGPGDPRQPLGAVHVDLSEQYGQPLPDFVHCDLFEDAGTDGPFAYMFIGEFFGPVTGPLGDILTPDRDRDASCEPEYNRFDLDDSFVIFRPYQTVGDWVEPEEPTSPGENSSANNDGWYELKLEYTPHKYTVTYGSMT